MRDAMAQEAKVRADPNLRADRFVERWQQLSQDRDRLYRAGDMTGREKAGKEMAGMAKSLERDPQVESILRGRERELGLEMGMGRWRSEEHTSALQSLMRISYAVFCLKTKTSSPPQSCMYLQHHTSIYSIPTHEIQLQQTT